MNNLKIKLGFTLFIIGMAGIFSLLTMPVATENLPPEILKEFSEEALKWLSLVNPAVMLLLAVISGTLLYDKVNLGAPILESVLKGESAGNYIPDRLKSGLSGGILAGILMLITEQLFRPHMPQEFIELGANLQLNPLVRFLYGGLTEEILVRFGLMTVLVWALSKMSKSRGAAIYLTAIFISSVLFAALHLPAVIMATGGLSTSMVLYILAGNTAGGVIFGWLYWRQGLEAAFIAHLMAHMVILLAGLLY